MFNDLPRPTVDLAKLREVHNAVLQSAAKGKHPVFAEMAREVLSGRMTMREAAGGAAYRDAFADATDAFVASMRAVPPDDLRTATEGSSLDDLIASLNEPDDEEEPAPPTRERQPNAEVDDASFDNSIMKRPDQGATGPDGTTPQRELWNRRWS